MGMTLYDILEVSQTASFETIRAAYRSLSQRYHPDKNPGDEEAAARMQQINMAFSILSSPETRAAYDTELAQKHSSNSASGRQSGYGEASGESETGEAAPSDGVTSIESATWNAISPYYAAVAGGVYADERLPAGRFEAISRLRANCNAGFWCGGIILGALLGAIGMESRAEDYFVGIGALLGLLSGVALSIMSWMFVTDRAAYRRERSARYYMAVFKAYHSARPLGLSLHINLSALMFNVFWFAYRRMNWAAAFGVLALAIVGSIGIIVEAIEPTLEAPVRLAALCAALGIGALGNRAYFRNAQARIRRVLSLPRPIALRQLRGEGGTNKLSWVGFVGLYFLLVIPAGYVAFFIEEDRLARERAVVERAAQEDAARSAEQLQYSQVLADIQARYPQLNSASPKYDRRLFEGALSRRDGYVRNGMLPSQALRQAIADMERGARSAQ